MGCMLSCTNVLSILNLLEHVPARIDMRRQRFHAQGHVGRISLKDLLGLSLFNDSFELCLNFSQIIFSTHLIGDDSQEAFTTCGLDR